MQTNNQVHVVHVAVFALILNQPVKAAMAVGLPRAKSGLDFAIGAGYSSMFFHPDEARVD